MFLMFCSINLFYSMLTIYKIITISKSHFVHNVKGVHCMYMLKLFEDGWTKKKTHYDPKCYLFLWETLATHSDKYVDLLLICFVHLYVLYTNFPIFTVFFVVALFHSPNSWYVVYKHILQTVWIFKRMENKYILRTLNKIEIMCTKRMGSSHYSR